MRTWSWPDWNIEQMLPMILATCVDLGLLVRVGDGFEPTPLVLCGRWPALSSLRLPMAEDGL